MKFDQIYVPIGSVGRLYIYLHEWLIFMVNVGKYTLVPWILCCWKGTKIWNLVPYAKRGNFPKKTKNHKLTVDAIWRVDLPTLSLERS